MAKLQAETNVETATRENWVDIAKCIGIFAIVYGHTIQSGWTCRYVYSFHVPLFFFLQGVVSSLGRIGEKPFGQYIRRKAYTLLVPYFIFATVSTGIIYLAYRVISVPGLDIFSSFTGVIANILMGDCESNSPLWFLPCSFVLSVIAYGAIKLANRPKDRIWGKCILFVMAMIGCIALYITEEFTSIKLLPWKMDTAVHMLPFFVVGYAVEEYGWMQKVTRLAKCPQLLIAVFLIGIGGVLGLLNGAANYLSNYYGNISVTYLAALASCLGICLLSTMLPSNGIMSRIGRATLCILLMHKFPILLFQVVIPSTATWIEQRIVPVGCLVTMVSIALCYLAQWVLTRICPVVIGQSKKTPKRVANLECDVSNACEPMS